MITTKLTREFFRKHRACYTDTRIDALVPEGGLTPLEVLGLDIPAADRVWALTRTGAIPERAQRLFAARCARRALSRVGGPDPRSLRACDVAEAFTEGRASREELAEAAEAAAAWAAAVAARARAAEAAWAAAAWAAGARAEREMQVQDMWELLDETAR